MDMENDCAVLISALATTSLDYSDIGRIVEDCKEYLASIFSVFFRHIHREANDVVNCLAHLASRSYIDDFWYEETPSIIEDVLYEDVCKCTRGQDITSPSLYGSVIINK